MARFPYEYGDEVLEVYRKWLQGLGLPVAEKLCLAAAKEEAT